MLKLKKQAKTPDINIIDNMYEITFDNCDIQFIWQNKMSLKQTEEKLMEDWFLVKFST